MSEGNDRMMADRMMRSMNQNISLPFIILSKLPLEKSFCLGARAGIILLQWHEPWQNNSDRSDWFDGVGWPPGTGAVAVCPAGTRDKGSGSRPGGFQFPNPPAALRPLLQMP